MLDKSYVRGATEPAVQEKTMGQLLQSAAESHPEKIALIAGVHDTQNRREISYAQLYADAQKVAKALLEKFEVGERVAVMAPNILEWVSLEFGSALAGTVLVTVNPSYRPEEIAYVLKQSGSVGIFVLPEFRGNQMLNSVEEVSKDCESLREIINLDNWSDFIRLGESSDIELPDVKPDDVTMIQYTSGTTGFPKGVLLHHRGLVNNGAHVNHSVGVEEGGVSIVMVPLFHTSGCVLGVLGAVSSCMTMVLVETFDPALVLELIETYKANTVGGVPTMLVAMIEHPEFVSRDLSSLTRVTSGGSTVPEELVRKFEKELGVKFLIMFGQTESSPVSSMNVPDDAPADKAHTIGGPMPNVEIKIVDPESGDIVPINAHGEYCTRGYHVMHGYYNMPEATAETVDEDGWLHTGDLCSMDERGYCKVEGRLKDMIIRGGENIYPKEIENALFEHASVGEVAVVGLPDKFLGEVVGAFLRPAPGEVINKKILFAYLREHLSAQKTPKHFFVVEEFPLTGSGKIQKFELRKQWEEGLHQEL
jgi:fatty-acyl-CoA synthase